MRACAHIHTHTTLSIITEVYIVLTSVLFSLPSVWQEQNQIHRLREAAPVLLHGWVTREPQSLSSYFLEANSCQARRHDWNPPTERRSHVLCLKKAACFISDLLGWNLKRKTEERLGILNGHLITLATVQWRRCSKNGWEAGCQSRGLVSVTLVLDKLNTILTKKKKIVVYG